MDSKRQWNQTFLLVGTLLIGSCAAQPQAASPPPVVVGIDRVESTQVQESTEFVARVEGVENATIRPRASGWIKQVYVRLGDRVSAGDRLMLIDSSQQQANLESRLAAVESRRAQLESAKANLDSQRAELRRLQAELSYQSQEANLRDAQQTLEAEIQEKQRIQYELEFLSEGANLRDAQEQLEAARRERERRAVVKEERERAFERYEKLWEEGVVSSEAYDQRLREIREAEASLAQQEDAVRSAKAQVVAAQQDLERRTSTLQAQIKTQQNRIEAARARVDSAGQAFERQVETLKAQIASQEKVIDAQQAEVNRLEREIQQAQAEATAEQVELEYYDVEAPISGVVGNLPVKVGDFVDSQTTLTSIRQNDRLEVNIDIPVQRLSEIRVGTPVEVISQETGEVIGTSRVSYISPSAGTDTQTILVKAIYNNQENQLRTDQIIRARVIWEQQPGITVPTTAINRIGAQSFVFVVEEQNQDGQQMLIAKQKPVELGSIQGQSYEVISGLKAGDRIVTEGVVKLRDGTPVTEPNQQQDQTSGSPSAM
ncbi:efflux RND transporter periplasmic adaptor subunit [Capilliphycus salinus ALCB114379]|uniref:efflux RND transporter periplasmic adaptor subunit n=1 Tax=Capilliphycus salinus TaxID=2768948 RepID=UPI0039A419AD